MQSEGKGDRVTGPEDRALTGREMEILRLVAAGRADKQIAAGLGISEETVAYHLRVLYDLRAVRCRAALVASLAHLLPEG